MSDNSEPNGPAREQRGKLKTSRIPIKVVADQGPPARKPRWIRAKAPTDPRVGELKKLIREQRLHTVCEEASCPNLGECFAHGTATFMIMVVPSATSPTAGPSPWTAMSR